MIVWVASYPRSGNSLAKKMLRDVFLIHGTSRYRAVNLSEYAAAARPREGPAFSYDFLGPWDEFRAAAQSAAHDIYIKTHELADDESRAIYVVRDPRSTLVSY